MTASQAETETIRIPTRSRKIAARRRMTITARRSVAGRTALPSATADGDTTETQKQKLTVDFNTRTVTAKDKTYDGKRHSISGYAIWTPQAADLTWTYKLKAEKLHDYYRSRVPPRRQSRFGCPITVWQMISQRLMRTLRPRNAASIRWRFRLRLRMMRTKISMSMKKAV